MSKKRLLLNFLALSCLINGGANAKESLKASPPKASETSKVASNVNKSDGKKAAVENRKASGFFSSEKFLTPQTCTCAGVGLALGLLGGGAGGYIAGANGKTEMNDKIASLTKKVSDEEIKINDKNSKISQLESEIQQLKNAGGADINALNEKIKNLENQISQKDQKITELNNEINGKLQQITILEATIKQKDEDIGKVQDAALGGNIEAQKVIQEAQKKVKGLEDENLKFKNELIGKEVEINNLKASNKTLIEKNKENTETVTKYENLKASYEKLKEQYEPYKSILKYLGLNEEQCCDKDLIDSIKSHIEWGRVLLDTVEESNDSAPVAKMKLDHLLDASNDKAENIKEIKDILNAKKYGDLTISKIKKLLDYGPISSNDNAKSNFKFYSTDLIRFGFMVSKKISDKFHSFFWDIYLKKDRLPKYKLEEGKSKKIENNTKYLDNDDDYDDDD